ncbi:TonB-dependent siderophore receptor [Catenovulum sp. 2E275]|uniref:TonB-dependent siderophore receptor n=1 Tax=Catenovulum sp. 2E275 TaxID=2980497 RepID=UPI0021CEB22E|nr:TonB-dependent siderophore receptor [Catenovulum sp. 2E275]MCU4675912.1 TonB-dependent siderophore receptor [Catenovulum sp. 2E275]
MNHPAKTLLALSILTAFNTTAQTVDDEADNIERIAVYGQKQKTKAATKLNLSALETPQVVSVLSRDQINDFSLRETNSLLAYAPGVTVEQVETGRTYYTARGFDIVNFQYDGMGVPFSYGLTQGHDDSALYEQIEVVKGATGLTTGLANPSATINFVRKRPTKDLNAKLSASAGSWNLFRLDGDVSGELVEDQLQGRLVIAKQEGDSYLDRYSKELNLFYGILSGYLTDSTKLSVGHTINDNQNQGNSSGAVPLFYSDGSLTNYDVYTNTAPKWAYQDVKQTRTFIELEQEIGYNWLLKAIYTHNKQDKAWESFYLAGAPDPQTNEGMLAHASFYEAKDEEGIVDLYLSGTFSLWGLEHDLVAGMNLADIKLTGRSVYSSEWNYNPVDADWAKGTTTRPAFDVYDPATQSTSINQEQNSFYISSRIRATEDLSFLLGARTVDIEQDGISYGAPQDASDNETVPYLGVTYQVLDGTVLYASTSEVFKAQTWVDADLSPLGSVRGESAEIGVKQELFSNNAVLTVALFESTQENFGEWIGRDETSGLNMYQGVEFESSGFEIELAGEVAQGLNVSAGFTKLSVEDENGNDTRRFIPTQQFKLAVAYELPMVSGLRVGSGINWQNEIYYANTQVQDSYALVDAFVQYKLNSQITLGLNINNLTDEKYRLSPQWGQANYGAPRNMMASISWQY